LIDHWSLDRRIHWLTDLCSGTSYDSDSDDSDDGSNYNDSDNEDNEVSYGKLSSPHFFILTGILATILDRYMLSGIGYRDYPGQKQGATMHTFGKWGPWPVSPPLLLQNYYYIYTVSQKTSHFRNTVHGE